MNRTLAAATGGLAIAAAATALYISSSTTAAAPQESVASARVERRTVTRTLTFQGTLEHGRQVELSAPADTLVTAVPVRIGDSVGPGQLLIRFAASDRLERVENAREGQRQDFWLSRVYPAQRRSLESASLALDARLGQEVGALAVKAQAIRSAQGEGIANAADLAAAERELQQARVRANAEKAAQTAQLRALDQQRLEAQLGRASASGKSSALAGSPLARGGITAPFAGTVAAISVGAYTPTRVAAGAHLVTLVDTASFTLAVPIPAAQLARVSRGGTALCFLPRRGQSVACRLDGIAKVESGYLAHYAITGAGDLERGEAADVRLVESGPQGALAVPSRALTRRGDAVGVMVARGGSRKFLPVKTLFFGDGLAAVSGALRAGETVLLPPA
jgi:multidrug efflux pump subunit AcrA (membrane-fusion protein)